MRWPLQRKRAKLRARAAAAAAASTTGAHRSQHQRRAQSLGTTVAIVKPNPHDHGPFGEFKIFAAIMWGAQERLSTCREE